MNTDLIWPIVQVAASSGILRSLFGYLENVALEGKQSFSWKMMLASVFRSGAIGSSFMAATGSGVTEAVGAGIIGDFAYSALKSKLKK